MLNLTTTKAYEMQAINKMYFGNNVYLNLKLVNSRKERFDFFLFKISYILKKKKSYKKFDTLKIPPKNLCFYE